MTIMDLNLLTTIGAHGAPNAEEGVISDIGETEPPGSRSASGIT